MPTASQKLARILYDRDGPREVTCPHCGGGLVSVRVYQPPPTSTRSYPREQYTVLFACGRVYTWGGRFA